MLEAGIRGFAAVAVTPENTARAMGSGTLEVFATPALAALAEKTCWQSVAAQLDEGMDGIEKITGRIAEDAGREVDGILTEARRQADEITARYEAQAKRE